jgi:hypothetical protein
MAGVHFNVPSLKVHVCLQDRPNIQMPDNTFCTTILYPATDTQQKMIISTMEPGNFFFIPSAQLNLRAGPCVQTRLSPCLCLRFTAPGNQIMNPNGDNDDNCQQLQQHMFTMFVHLSQLLPCISSGRPYQIKIATNEDQRSYFINIVSAQPSPSVQQQVQESIRVLSEHVKNLEHIHGRRLILIPDAVRECNQGRERRWAEIKRTAETLFGDQQGIAEWFLCMNRMFNGMKIDMAQSNFLRESAVKLNPEFNIVMLMFICGGMMSEIANDTGAQMTSEESVNNQVDVWCSQDDAKIKESFLMHLIRHNATTSAYLSDAGWDMNDMKLFCAREAKEDQFVFAGFPLEAVLNYMLFKVKLKLGDCEDLTAMILGVMDLFKIPREAFFSSVANGIPLIPVYYKDSSAASDFTAHPSSLQKIAMRMWELFQSPPAEPKRQLNGLRDLMDACLSTKSNLSQNVSIVSILARAPRVDQTSLGGLNTQTYHSLETYADEWKRDLVTSDLNARLQGHACGIIDSTKTLGAMGNVTLDLVMGQPSVLESTSNATERPSNNLTNAFFGNHTPERQQIQDKLGGDNVVLPRNLTCNIQSTLLSRELITHLPADTKAFAAQSYTLGTASGPGSFYVLKLNSDGANFTMGLDNTGKPIVEPGHAMNTDEFNGDRGRQLRMTSAMDDREKYHLEVLAAVGEAFTMNLPSLANNKMLPQINPLLSRAPLTIDTGTRLALVTPLKLRTETMSTGCTLKQPYDVSKSKDLQAFAKEVGEAVHRVFPPNARMTMGPFFGGVTVEAPL